MSSTPLPVWELAIGSPEGSRTKRSMSSPPCAATMLMRTRYLLRLGGVIVRLKKSQRSDRTPPGKQPMTGLETGTEPVHVTVGEAGEMAPLGGGAASRSGAGSPARRRPAMAVAA